MFEFIYLYYHNSLSNSDSWTVNFEVSALWTYVDYVSNQKESTALSIKWVSDVTFSQVWWPILRISALHLTHPKCTHTEQWTHTHTVNTHPEQWAAILCCGARGAVGGSMPCSRAPKSWYWRWRENCTCTPPTHNSCRPETRTHNPSIGSPTL